MTEVIITSVPGPVSVVTPAGSEIEQPTGPIQIITHSALPRAEPVSAAPSPTHWITPSDESATSAGGICPVQLITAALQGPPGPPGPASAGNALTGISFQYNQASPIAFPLAVGTGKILLHCLIVIDTPFDGVGAQVTVGTLVDPTAFVSTAQCDPYQPGQYFTSPGVRAPSDWTAYLFITPGADAHQGAGYFCLYFEG